MAKVEKISDSRVKLTIDVTAAQFEKGLDHAFNEIKDEVEIKGFRKGKVSRKVFEQHKGVESLYEDAINHVIQETYYSAIQAESLDVVAQPKIDLDITTVKKDSGFTYTATVALKPTVELGQYKGFTYTADAIDVTDEEISAKIEELRGQNAQLIVKDEAVLAKDDTAVFDFEGFVDGEAFEGGKAENHELVIGSGQFIPGFEDQMIGMKPGEARDIQVTFPEQYQAEQLAGKEATFKTKLHEVKVRQVPELNDDFVKDLEREGVETVEALKESTKEALAAEKKQNSENKAIDFAVEQAASQAKVDIPEEMITQEKNRQIDNIKRQVQQYGMPFEQYLQFSGLDEETFEKNTIEQAEKAIRYNLTIEAIAAKENIEATDKEIEAKYDDIAKQYNLEVEQVRDQVNEEAVKQEVIFRKTIDFLVAELKPEDEEQAE